MMQRNPSDRPTAAEALSELELHASRLRRWKVHWRLHKRDESRFPMVLRDARTAVADIWRHGWAIVRKSMFLSSVVMMDTYLSSSSYHNPSKGVTPLATAVVLFPLSVLAVIFVTGPQKALQFLRRLTFPSHE